MAQIQPYTVVRSLGAGAELRHYPAHTLISCDVGGDFDSAGNRGFGPLVRYISGANQQGQQIAMTSPVLHATQSEATHTISFVLPEGMNPDDAPMPSDGRVQVHLVPPRVVSALRFAGGWSKQRADLKAQALLGLLGSAGLTPSGAVFFARYDPPWKPGLLRRNEALVEVMEPSTTSHSVA
jgi:hypothetical protein